MGERANLRRPGRIIPFVLLALSALSLFVPAAMAWDSTSGTTAATAATTTGTNSTTLSPTECANCHGNVDNLTRHHSTPYFTQGECTHCHVGISTSGDCSGCHTFGVQNNHHTTTEATSGNCAACHTNVGDYRNCLSCHQGKTRTRHHQIASTGVACASCHSTLVPVTGCRACHVNPVRQRHHDVAASQSISCKTCHSGIVETPDGCKSCHNFQSPNVNPHHSAAVDPYGMTCMSCHPLVWDTATSRYKTQLPGIAECKSCHETKVGTAPIATTHHMTVPATTGQCTSCHVGVTPVSDCTICHSTAGGAIVTRHHSTALYQQGACITCHAGAEAAKITCANCHAKPPHHLQPQAVAGDCNYCHSTIELLGTGCKSCHTQPIPQIHHAAPLESVGGDCSVCHQSVSSPTSCANCHQSSPHHTTTWSQTGDCAHCHTVPAAQADRPKQAACRECHGSFQHNKGGPIQNYGACAACHATVPFHPAPTSIPGYTGYGAGKKKFNMFWSRYAIKEGPGEPLEPNGSDLNDEGGFRIRAVQLAFTKVQISNNGKTYTVPSFDTTSPLTLAVCTSCHTDRSSLVNCTNTKWRDHLTLNRVNLATYQLAETTYIGSLCGSAGGGALCTVATSGTYIEAENYNALGTNFSVQTSTSGANGGKYLKASFNSTSSTSGTPVSYTLKFGETGTYYLWFRGNDSRNSSYNSLWYGLNGTRVGDVQTPASDYNWRWVNARASYGPSYAAITINTAGTHTLNVWAREANFQLDGIYITKVSGTLPGGTAVTIPTGSAVISPTSCGVSTDTTTGSTGGSTGGTTPTTPTNLALNKTATASRYESGYEPAKAVDGDAGTGWWARSDNDHYIRVDLGSSQSISKVVISWGTYYAEDYQISLSTDGSNWSRVVDVQERNGGTQTHTFTARSARYVRVYCTKARSSYGYAINELSVFN